MRKAQLKQFCSTMDRYCVIVDFWTESKTGIHYGGVALRHIDTEMRLHNYILGCYPYDIDKDQKAPNIRAFVEEILDEYGLELNLSAYLVSNNEAKMKSAFGLDYCKRIGCSDHYLSKQLQHSFTSMTIDKENVDWNCSRNGQKSERYRYSCSSFAQTNETSTKTPSV